MNLNLGGRVSDFVNEVNGCFSIGQAEGVTFQDLAVTLRVQIGKSFTKFNFFTPQR